MIQNNFFMMQQFINRWQQSFQTIIPLSNKIFWFWAVFLFYFLSSFDMSNSFCCPFIACSCMHFHVYRQNSVLKVCEIWERGCVFYKYIFAI